jgi:hypothetical protein
MDLLNFNWFIRGCALSFGYYELCVTVRSEQSIAERCNVVIQSVVSGELGTYTDIAKRPLGPGWSGVELNGLD